MLIRQIYPCSSWKDVIKWGSIPPASHYLRSIIKTIIEFWNNCYNIEPIIMHFHSGQLYTPSVYRIYPVHMNCYRTDFCNNFLRSSKVNSTYLAWGNVEEDVF